MKFDKTNTSRFNCRIVAIAMVGFRILNYRSGRRFTFSSVPFFVPCFHQFSLRASILVEWVRGASARWLCFCNQYSNSHSLRLVPFRIGSGGFKTGAYTMTQALQAESATTTQDKALLTKLAIQELEEDMSQLQTLYYTIESELAPNSSQEDSPCYAAWMLCKLANNTLSNLSSLNLIIQNNKGATA